MVLLAIRHFVTAKVRGRIWLVGDAMGVWFGMVRFNAKAKQINETAKEVAMHLAPLGHDLVGVYILSEASGVKPTRCRCLSFLPILLASSIR